MQNNSQKRGIALGAVIALISSLFVGLMPASAADAVNGGKIALTPVAGATGNFNGTIIEDFPLQAYLLPGEATTSAQGQVIFEITKTSGNVDILLSSTSAAATSIGDAATLASASAATDASWSYITAGQTTASKVTMNAASANSAHPLVMRAVTTSANLSTQSAVLTVKVWIENTATANGNHDAAEWFTTATVTLHAVTAIPATGTVAALQPGDTTVTVSMTVGTLNFDNLDGGEFYVKAMSSTNSTYAGHTGSGNGTSESAAINGNVMTSRSGVVSNSFAVSDSDGVSANQSMSARAYYSYAGTAYAIGSTASSVVSNPNVSELFVDIVAGDNATVSSGVAKARANTTTTFVIGAKTASSSVSRVVSVKLTDVDSSLSTTKRISVNGGALTSSFPSATSPISVTTNATTGQATFTIMNDNFVGGETYTVTAYVGNISKSLTVDTEASSWTLASEYTTYQSGPGEVTNIVYSVKDQWGVLSSRTDQRVHVTRGTVTGFNYSATVSTHALVGGTATVAYTPQPATATGSATVDAKLQHLNLNTGGYVDSSVAAGQVTVNISSAANSFGDGLAVSRSVSVSYFPDTTSWVTVTGEVANTGSAVVVSGAGLVFRASAGATQYDDTITVRASGTLGYTFDVAGKLAGNFTITLTNGTDSTTSLVVVDAADHESGADILFDTTTIQAGKTRIVTGTVVDINGNPVNTTAEEGTASIVVTYAGTAGIPVGTMPTETDADGKFRVSILTSAADQGSFTLTATYLKAGAATAAVDKVTKVQTITVGESAASASGDQKVNAGSFKGYVAVYAKGYEGKRLSAKIGNDWVVVEALASNFERVTDFTGAGYTIAVRIYIDRVLVDTITVTTK